MNREQTTISGDRVKSAKPEDVKCEWCPDPSVVAVEMERKVGRGVVKTGQFVYACGTHEQTAREYAAADNRR